MIEEQSKQALEAVKNIITMGRIDKCQLTHSFSPLSSLTL